MIRLRPRTFQNAARKAARAKHKQTTGVLTENLFLGMNFLSMAGFAVIATSLILVSGRNLRARQQKVRSIAIALMVTGTVLVAFGIYFSPPQAIKIPEHRPVSTAPQSR